MKECTMFSCHCGKCSPVILAKEESYDFPIELGEYDNEMFTVDELLGDEDENS